MIPPETTSKEQTAMSTAGGPISDQAEAAPDLSAMGERRTGHGVTVKGLTPTTAPSMPSRTSTSTFPANQVTAIIGPSGSGKSTVVRCINRMHEEIPGARAEGSIKLDEHRCLRRRASTSRRSGG